MIPALQFDNWQWLALALASPVVVWGAYPFHQRRLGQRPSWRRDDGHARQRRSRRRLALVAVGAVHRRRRRDRHEDEVLVPAQRCRARRDLPRGRHRGDGVHPRRPLPRGQRQDAVQRSPARAHGPRRTRRHRAARRRGVADPARRPARGRPVRRTPRREGRHRRSRRGGLVLGRRVDADRRVRARRRRAEGDVVTGATDQPGRPARRTRHRRRRRHPARPDGAAGRGGAGGQGRGPAPRRPRLRVVRARRHRARARHACCLVRRRLHLDRGVHRRRRRADHRVPVRPRPRDADGADGGHGSRRPARHPHQGPPGARVDPHDRHRRARQDRHRHDRPHDGVVSVDPVAGRRPRTSCAWSPHRSSTPRSTPSPGRSRPSPNRSPSATSPTTPASA